jgi:hypothetical protein
VEEGGHTFEQVALVIQLVVGARLLHRAVQTGGVQERLLGIAIGTIGLSYLLYQIPYEFELEAHWPYYYFAGRVVYDLAVFVVALLTRRVFESDRIWAGCMVWASALLMASGLAISVWNGNWGGTAPLSDPGFWLEWVGEIVPFAWLTAEALVQCGKLRQSERLGLSPPGVSHRFLLLGLFGLAELSGSFAEVPMYVEIETRGQISMVLDLLLSLTEILAAAALWLAFFPPAFYRRRVERSAASGGAGR